MIWRGFMSGPSVESATQAQLPQLTNERIPTPARTIERLTYSIVAGVAIRQTTCAATVLR